MPPAVLHEDNKMYVMFSTFLILLGQEGIIEAKEFSSVKRGE